MNQCRNQNRPNALLMSVLWTHGTFSAGIRKVRDEEEEEDGVSG